MGSGGLARKILNLGASWKKVISLTFQLLYPPTPHPKESGDIYKLNNTTILIVCIASIMQWSHCCIKDRIHTIKMVPQCNRIRKYNIINNTSFSNKTLYYGGIMISAATIPMSDIILAVICNIPRKKWSLNNAHIL
jgi:hypothetical protein